MGNPKSQVMEMQPPAYDASQEIDPSVFDVLTREMMKKTFGSLFSRYKNEILGSLPPAASYDDLRKQLLFLRLDTDTHPIAYSGYDTWDSPIDDMDLDQIRAGLSALTFLSRKIQKQLATSQGASTTLLDHQDDFGEFVRALNSIGPIRGALLTRKADLQGSAAASFGASYGTASSSSSGLYSSRHDNFFIDYFFYWNPHQSCYHYHHCAYDYHRGFWSSPSYVHHDHSAWHLGEIPFSKMGHAFSQNVVKTTAQGVTEIFGRIFETSLKIREGAVDLGGRMIDLAGKVLDQGRHDLNCSGVCHSACDPDPCFFGLRYLGEGCGDLAGGCCDILKVCETSCCEVLSCLSQVPTCHCGNADCRDAGCSGGGGDALTVVCGGLGSCCYGTFSLLSRLCKGKKTPPPPPAEPGAGASMTETVARRSSVLDPLTNHPYYDLGGWVLTGVNLCCCTFPLMMSQVQNFRVITGTTATERQRTAAKIDCCLVTTATGTMALAGTFCFSSAVWGPKVIINTLTAVGTSTKALSKLALDHHAAKHHEGVLEPETYFLTAKELNEAVDRNTKPNQEPWNTLDTIARKNTDFMREAEEAKNAQSAPLRHLRALPGLFCPTYLNCKNGDERRHDAALGKIEQLRGGNLSGVSLSSFTHS